MCKPTRRVLSLVLFVCGACAIDNRVVGSIDDPIRLRLKCSVDPAEPTAGEDYEFHLSPYSSSWRLRVEITDADGTMDLDGLAPSGSEGVALLASDTAGPASARVYHVTARGERLATTCAWNVADSLDNQPPVISLPDSKTIHRGERLLFDLMGSFADSADPNVVDVSGTHDPDGQIESVCWEADANFMAQATPLGIGLYCSSRPSRELGDGGYSRLMEIWTRLSTTWDVPFESITAGEYTITMVVTDDQGASSQDSLTLIIEEPSGDNPPVFSLPAQITARYGVGVILSFSPYMVRYWQPRTDRAIVDLSTAYDPDGQLYNVQCGYWSPYGGSAGSGTNVKQDMNAGCSTDRLAAGTYGFYVVLSDLTGNETRVESELVVLPAS